MHELVKHNPTQASAKRSQPISDNTSIQSYMNPIQLMQQTVGNQGLVQLYSGNGAQGGEDSGRDSRVGSMSAQLQKRIEKMSGMSLDDIKVHYNSNKPHQLGAHAYAQGNEIHLAPQQEQHLPHEAWHIVQQRQGRVQPTMQMKGVQVNESSLLEQEATKMGDLASSHLELAQISNMNVSTEKNLHTSSAKAPAQLYKLTENYSRKNVIEEEKPFDTNDGEAYEEIEGTTEQYKKFRALLTTIGQAVDLARKQSLQWQSLKNDKRNHIKSWYQAAEKYSAAPDDVPKFLYARFGYAIETIACDALGDAIEGFTIKYQLAKGHTRPDIVVLQDGDEIGWVDITSKKSEEHILYKQGGGWTTRDYVYEVLYDELSPTELLTGNSNPYYKDFGDYMNGYYDIVTDRENEVRSKLSDELFNYTSSETFHKNAGANKQNRAKLVREFIPVMYSNVLAQMLPESKKNKGEEAGVSAYSDAENNTKKRNRNHEYDEEAQFTGEPIYSLDKIETSTPRAMKGAISYLGESTTWLGYKNNKMSSSEIQQDISSIVKMTSFDKVKGYHADYLKLTISQMNDHPLKEQFIEKVESDPVMNESENYDAYTQQAQRYMRLGMVVKHALDALQKLDSWQQSDDKTHSEEISEAIKKLPKELMHDKLLTWLDGAFELLDKRPAAEDEESMMKD